MATRRQSVQVCNRKTREASEARRRTGVGNQTPSLLILETLHRLITGAQTHPQINHPNLLVETRFTCPDRHITH